MASTRLNNDMRDRLIKDIVRDQFDEHEGVIWDQWAQFADVVYNECFSETDRARMEKLPDGWMPTNDTIKVQIAGEVTELKFNGDPYKWGHNRPRFISRDAEFRMFPSRKKGTCIKVFDPSTEVADHWQSLCNDRDDLLKQIDEVRAEIRAVIYSCSSTKTLLETWPEIEPFVKSLNIPAPVKNVPAKRIADLNTRLGLTAVEDVA